MDAVMQILNETRCKDCNHYSYICICKIIDEFNQPERLSEKTSKEEAIV
jgi:hypothetical protein